MSNLQNSLRSLKNPPKPSTLSGSLGLSPTVVNVPTRLGFSYVRLLGNTSEVIQAYNPTVSATFDVPVTVQWDGTKYVVIGRDVNRYTSWTSSPYLPQHAYSHGLRGGDTLWIASEQFTPLLVYPSGTSLQIAPYTYNWQGTWKNGGGGISGITLPSDPTKQKIMLLYVDGPTATPSWLAGTEAPSGLTLKTDLVPYLPSFQTSVGLPVAMVRIPSGTTSFTWDNLYDMRQYFQGSYSGSSGGSTSLPTGSASILGGFRVGTGLSVYPDGTLNATGGSGSSGPPGFQTLTDGSTIDWNLALGSAKVTLGGNRTLNNPSNMGAGETYFLEVFQDTSGSRHISTWGSAYKFPGYNKPTLSVAKNREDVISFGCDGTYMNYLGMQLNLVNSGTSLGYQTNLSTWLEARLQSYSNAGSVLCVDGDPVYETLDQSASSMNAVQTTLANRPIYKDNILNSQAVWRFDGTNSLYLQMTGMNPGNSVSFFFVLAPGTTTPIGILDGAPTQAPDWIRNYGNGNWDEASSPAIDFTLPNTSPVLLEFVHSQGGGGRTVKYYKNGTLITTATNASTATVNWNNPTLGTINLGGDGKYNGDMAAFLCYHESISDANRALVESYLKSVYGII